MLESLWKKIVRRKPYSWWAVPALFLRVASVIYRCLFLIRKFTVGKPVKLPIPVISVGNVTVGGSGKTPIVEMIARDLQAEGVRVGIVSSGYRRQSRESLLEPGYRVQKLNAAQTGDEVQILAWQLPEAVFSVDRSKTAAALRLAESGQVDVLVVDDGFQHFSLARDLEVVTYDAALRREWLRLFPHGFFREPMTALGRADAIIITRSKFARDINRLRARLARFSPGAEIYHAGFTLDELISRDKRLPAKYLEDKSVFLFAGVGNFRPLQKQVAALAGDLDHALELSDHQEYDRPLLERIRSLAAKFDSDVIVTTYKDWVKLGDFDFESELYYLGLSIDLDPGEEKLVRWIMQMLRLNRQRT